MPFEQLYFELSAWLFCYAAKSSKPCRVHSPGHDTECIHGHFCNQSLLLILYTIVAYGILNGTIYDVHFYH